jgi:hypothetical protein
MLSALSGLPYQVHLKHIAGSLSRLKGRDPEDSLPGKWRCAVFLSGSTPAPTEVSSTVRSSVHVGAPCGCHVRLKPRTQKHCGQHLDALPSGESGLVSFATSWCRCASSCCGLNFMACPRDFGLGIHRLLGSLPLAIWKNIASA